MTGPERPRVAAAPRVPRRPTVAATPRASERRGDVAEATARATGDAARTERRDVANAAASEGDAAGTEASEGRGGDRGPGRGETRASRTQAVIIVLTLGAILAVILARSLRADLTRYNKEELAPLAGGGGGGGGDDGGDDLDETGWKVVHADVYRPPHYPGFLCALVATGAQLGVMAFLVLLFARVRRRPNERLG